MQKFASIYPRATQAWVFDAGQALWFVSKKQVEPVRRLDATPGSLLGTVAGGRLI